MLLLLLALSHQVRSVQQVTILNHHAFTSYSLDLRPAACLMSSLFGTVIVVIATTMRKASDN